MIAQYKTFIDSATSSCTTKCHPTTCRTGCKGVILSKYFRERWRRKYNTQANLLFLVLFVTNVVGGKSTMVEEQRFLLRRVCIFFRYRYRIPLIIVVLFPKYQIILKFFPVTVFRPPIVNVAASACGVHLKAGDPKVHSVINVLHFTTCGKCKIPSSSVL
jgi:hypothetical protein